MAVGKQIPLIRGRARYALLLDMLLLAPLVLTGVLAGCSPSAAPEMQRAAAGAGAALYSGNCVACHQQDAHGIPGVYPSLAGSPVVLGDPAAFTLWVVKGRRPESLPAGRYGTAMPQFGWMKDTDVAALLTYLRTHFGNGAAPVSPAALSRVVEE
jgi:mono/diheme cytochrome c family protein